jgi:hypothetical protein
MQVLQAPPPSLQMHADCMLLPWTPHNPQRELAAEAVACGLSAERPACILSSPAQPTRSPPRPVLFHPFHYCRLLPLRVVRPNASPPRPGVTTHRTPLHTQNLNSPKPVLVFFRAGQAGASGMELLVVAIYPLTPVAAASRNAAAAPGASHAARNAGAAPGVSHAARNAGATPGASHRSMPRASGTSASAKAGAGVFVRLSLAGNCNEPCRPKTDKGGGQNLFLPKVREHKI